MENRRWPHPRQPHGGLGSPTPGRGDAQSSKRPCSPGPGVEGCFAAHPRVIPPFPFPFDLFPLFFILTEGLQHQGLCWSKQGNCLNNPGFYLFCFHLFSSELAGQRLVPIRQKISAHCCTPGSGGAAGPGLPQTRPTGRAPAASIPHRPLASHTGHSRSPRTSTGLRSAQPATMQTLPNGAVASGETRCPCRAAPAWKTSCCPGQKDAGPSFTPPQNQTVTV